jgi:DNA-binding NtrC family response regulator
VHSTTLPNIPAEGTLARPAHGPGRVVPPVLYVQDPGETEVERLLQAMQAPMQRCTTGREAIEIARNQPLSCIIATLLLRDMSATAMIGALRQVAPGLAVIVIVDNPAVSEAVAVMQAGAHAVVDSRVLSTGLFHNVSSLLREA